jgi:hypothetical protein
MEAFVCKIKIMNEHSLIYQSGLPAVKKKIVTASIANCATVPKQELGNEEISRFKKLMKP